MNKSNYALISALYDTKGANLYNDIYFPIIKYEIANQYYTQKDIEKYYSLEELQRSINTNFGIKIPLIVLKQTIKAIGLGNNEISISIIENGKFFQIKKAWDISLNVSVDNKSQEIAAKFTQLELLFQRFLEVEQLNYKKSFLEFYSDNTEEIFNFIEEIDCNVIINENYINLTRFLVWLKETDTELFNIANDIFWASIIAGFLKREKVELDIKPLEQIEYYLDSSLVLAILDLDNIDNVAYGQELLDIIKSSGNIPKVHSLTIREINSILTSVERDQSPKPNSAIEEAYYRRELTPSKILQIKNKLLSLIEDKGIVVFPVPERELDDIISSYKNKKSVKDLEQIRTPYYNNNFTIRDIHDVYLRDFIRKKRGIVAKIEKVNSYFVSLNSDLISFFQTENPNDKTIIIHPAKIITDLWIHNSNCTLLKKNALTEVMSRCFALNNTDIRRKLRLVSKYYKESDSDYSEEHYRAVYVALVNRSAMALKEVEEISITEQGNPTNKEELNKVRVQSLIKISIDEDLRKKQNLISLAVEKEQLENVIKSKDKALFSKDKASGQYKKQVESLKKELENERQKAVLTEQINNVADQIKVLEDKKNKSISMFKFGMIISLEILAVVVFVVCLIFLLASFLQKNDLNLREWILKDKNISLLLGGAISAISFLYRVQKMYLLSPKIQCENHKSEQEKHWIKCNPKYDELKEQFLKLQTERKELNNN